MSVFVCEYVHTNVDSHRGDKRLLETGLELQVVVSCLVWVLGMELGSSAMAEQCVL